MRLPRNVVYIAATLQADWVLAVDSTPNTGDQLQAFMFAYIHSNLVLPITYTCPTPLTLTQIKPTNAGGPDPAAPYSMVLFGEPFPAIKQICLKGMLIRGIVHEQLMDGAGVQYERMHARTLDVGDMSSVQSTAPMDERNSIHRLRLGFQRRIRRMPGKLHFYHDEFLTACGC